MKPISTLSKKALIVLITTTSVISLLFWSCSKDQFKTISEVDSVANNSLFLKSASISINISPSANPVKVGNCLYFTGIATQNGKPVSGLKIGVEDPIKQQSIPLAATTDSKGKFTYYVEKMCPAINNDMIGVFEFKFFAGSVTTKSKVSVNTTNPTGMDMLTAINNGTEKFIIKLMVDKKDKGSFTVSPGKTVNLFQGTHFGNSTIIATILNGSNKILWKATYTDTPINSSKSSTFLNPYYNNYWANTSVSINGTSKSKSINGVGKVYSDYVNKDWTVGGYKVKAENNVTYGVATKTELGVQGPNCKTFLGFKASCTVSVGVSAGLQLCAGWGAGWAIGPVTAGTKAQCCVEIASASCNVADIGVSASAVYK
jgi:hypothetical protein